MSVVLGRAVTAGACTVGQISLLLDPGGPGVRVSRGGMSRLDRPRPVGAVGRCWPGVAGGPAWVLPSLSLWDMIFSKAVNRLWMDGGQCGSRGYPPNRQ